LKLQAHLETTGENRVLVLDKYFYFVSVPGWWFKDIKL